MRSIWAWFWGLDRSVPWEAWSVLLALGLLLRGANWLTGYPDHLPVELRIGLSALSLLLLLAWFVLYVRDARGARRRARAAGEPIVGGPRPPRRQVIAGIVAVLTTPIVSAWAVGDLGEPPTAETYYAIHPLGVPHGLSVALTALCVIGLVASLGVLIEAAVSGRMWLRWWLSLAPAMLAGGIFGLTYRATTAPTFDANIGGSVAIVASVLIGIPLVVVSVGLAIVAMSRSSREPPAPGADRRA